MHLTGPAHSEHGYLVPKPQAWFAFVLSFLLMTFYFVDRQIVLPMFPYLKAEWEAQRSRTWRTHLDRFGQ